MEEEEEGREEEQVRRLRSMASLRRWKAPGGVTSAGREGREGEG